MAVNSPVLQRTKIGYLLMVEVVATRDNAEVQWIKENKGIDLVGTPLGVAIRTEDTIIAWGSYFADWDTDFNKKKSGSEKVRDFFGLNNFWVKTPLKVFTAQLELCGRFLAPDEMTYGNFNFTILSREAYRKAMQARVRKSGAAFLDIACTVFFPSPIGSLSSKLVRSKIVSFTVSQSIDAPMQKSLLQELGIEI